MYGARREEGALYCWREEQGSGLDLRKEGVGREEES
jgi:hypothetical protein